MGCRISMLAYKEMQDAVDGTALNGHQQSILAGVHQPTASKKWDWASNILDFFLKSFAFVSSSASGPRHEGLLPPAACQIYRRNFWPVGFRFFTVWGMRWNFACLLATDVDPLIWSLLEADGFNNFKNALSTHISDLQNFFKFQSTWACRCFKDKLLNYELKQKLLLGATSSSCINRPIPLFKLPYRWLISATLSLLLNQKQWKPNIASLLSWTRILMP